LLPPTNIIGCVLAALGELERIARRVSSAAWRGYRRWSFAYSPWLWGVAILRGEILLGLNGAFELGELPSSFGRRHVVEDFNCLWVLVQPLYDLRG